MVEPLVPRPSQRTKLCDCSQRLGPPLNHAGWPIRARPAEARLSIAYYFGQVDLSGRPWPQFDRASRVVQIYRLIYS